VGLYCLLSQVWNINCSASPTPQISPQHRNSRLGILNITYSSCNITMAPLNPRKRKSDEMEEAAPSITTPTGSPARKRMKISQQQKQALIDNLQLESTYAISLLIAHLNLVVSYRASTTTPSGLRPAMRRPTLPHRAARQPHSHCDPQDDYGRTNPPTRSCRETKRLQDITSKTKSRWCGQETTPGTPITTNLPHPQPSSPTNSSPLPTRQETREQRNPNRHRRYH
jgi:hypothetical protein